MRVSLAGLPVAQEPPLRAGPLAVGEARKVLKAAGGETALLRQVTRG